MTDIVTRRAAVAMTALMFADSGVAALAAESSEGLVWIDGAGSVNCGSISIGITDDSKRLQIWQWVSGFLTAYNYYNKPGVRPPERDAVLGYIEKYCRENPLSLLAAGSYQLVIELGGKELPKNLDDR